MNNYIIKQNLVNAYKILAHLKLDDHTYTHLSAKSAEGDSFYIYPFGMRFEEVKVNDLLKVTYDGKILEGQEYQYNRTGYVIHGAIYQKRPDIQAVFHIHTPEIIAVSACEDGLLPISQWALHFYGKISYHDYNSLALDEAEGARLFRDLGENYTMLLRNHGSITCGRTIWEAMFYTYHLQLACKTQCFALSMNQKLVMPSDEVCEKSVHDLLSFEKNLGARDWRAWINMLKAQEFVDA